MSESERGKELDGEGGIEEDGYVINTGISCKSMEPILKFSIIYPVSLGIEKC